MNKLSVSLAVMVAFACGAACSQVPTRDPAPTAFVQAVKNDCGTSINAQQVWDGLNAASRADPAVVDKFSNVCSTFGIDAK